MTAKDKVIAAMSEYVTGAEPPQKYSMNDADFDAEIGSKIEITFDGERQDSVIAYDVAAGTIERHRKVGGQYVLDGANLAVETVNGVVGVSWK